MWNTFVANVERQNPAPRSTSPSCCQPEQHPGPAERPDRDHRPARGATARTRSCRSRAVATGRSTPATTRDPTGEDQRLQHRDRAPHGGQRRRHQAPRRLTATRTSTRAHRAVRRQLRLQRDRARERPQQHHAVAAGQHPELGQGAVLQPGRPGAFVRTPAGQALLTAAGVTPGLPRVRDRQRRDRDGLSPGTGPTGDTHAMTITLTRSRRAARRRRRGRRRDRGCARLLAGQRRSRTTTVPYDDAQSAGSAHPVLGGRQGRHRGQGRRTGRSPTSCWGRRRCRRTSTRPGRSPRCTRTNPARAWRPASSAATRSPPPTGSRTRTSRRRASRRTPGRSVTSSPPSRPTYDGYVQLRLYLGTPEAGTLSDQPYDTADLRVDGDRWELVRGGTASCADAASAVLP